MSLGGSISFEVESQPTVNAKIALDVKGNIKRNIRYGPFSAGTDNLFGMIKHAQTEMLRSSTGQNVIRSTQCSEEEKLGIHAGEAEVKRLLGDSKAKKAEPHGYLNTCDVPDIVMNLCCACACVCVCERVYTY